MVDDRLPVVLVILDGLGDRPVPELGGATPSEAAHTPVLDALAAAGASGWHLPFGWGVATSSERSHWAMLGYAGEPFCGRAVLEALGAGIDVDHGAVAVHGALRTSRAAGDRLWITGRAGPGDRDDVAALVDELAGTAGRHGVHIVTLPPADRGEVLLLLPRCDSAEITDSDPFFEHLHPWLRVRPTSPPGRLTADALTAFLLDARTSLVASPVNATRGRPLDVLTTKWAGMRRPLPTFAERVGVPGAAVTSTRLYRGLSTLLGLRQHHVAPDADVAADLRTRLEVADGLISEGARFVHVHTKATDEAGHTKDPHAKRDVLAAADAGLAGLPELARRAVVAVTGDHATPSVGGVLHTGDPTPLVVAGPAVRPDAVRRFGESFAAHGCYGGLRATELLPLLFGHANRPAFLGHRPAPAETVALPDDPEPMPPGR